MTRRMAANYQLQKETNDLVQWTLDVTSYYTKMKKLREEMNNTDVNSVQLCVYLLELSIYHGSMQ